MPTLGTKTSYPEKLDVRGKHTDAALIRQLYLDAGTVQPGFESNVGEIRICYLTDEAQTWGLCEAHSIARP